MTRREQLEVALVVVLGATLAGSTVINVRQFRRLAAVEQERVGDLQALRALQAALRNRAAPPSPAERAGPAPSERESAALAQREAEIARLNRELSDAAEQIKDLQAQLASEKAEGQNLIVATTERHEKEQADWQSRLDSLKQELDSAQTDLQNSRDRLSAVEADNTRLRSDAKDGSARAAELEKTAASLEDLDRRRAAYLTSILRRYRDITNQFRAMGGMLDTSPNSSAFTGESLTRIQNAISQAEDDLRQVNELDAQARQIERRLEKK